jgi:hypothetical protein
MTRPESEDMTLEKALEEIKGFNDRYELQIKLAEADAGRRRAHEAAKARERERKRSGWIWR